MKKTCRNCRALEDLSTHFNCSLGYKIEQVYEQIIFLVSAKPKEECPKPKTYDELMKLYKIN